MDAASKKILINAYNSNRDNIQAAFSLLQEIEIQIKKYQELAIQAKAVSDVTLFMEAVDAVQLFENDKQNVNQILQESQELFDEAEKLLIKEKILPVTQIN